MAADWPRGFALIFVVITLAVMAIVGIVVVANGANTALRAEVQALSTGLLRLKSDIGTHGGVTPAFASDVGANPARLSQLFAVITTADSNSCRAKYGNNDVKSWLGPYHLVPMLRGAGYQITSGIVVDDTLVRIPPTGGSNQAATLALVMRSVPIDVAQALGQSMDGVSTGAGPTVIFTPNGSNPVTMYYYVPIVGC